ncbi:MAG: lamin tail domain-containing protein [Bacteroidales bacterium]|nr:lamin tail domain-containing protein [Bacteroidales bacterium]
MKKLSLIFLYTLIPFFLFAQQYRIIISELMYQTPFNEGRIPYLYNGEFASIFNYGNVQIDISGWSVVSDGQGQTFTFPQGSIMQPRARFFVAHTNAHLNFRLEHLFDWFALGVNDRVFYESRIIHANAGESFRLYRADGTMQDSIFYEGTSRRTQNPRLEAFNANGTPGSACVSLQRRNVTVDENGAIVFCRLDWATNRVALTRYPILTLTENGIPVFQVGFSYDASGNRIGRRTIMLPAPQVAPLHGASLASAMAKNAEEENNYILGREEPLAFGMPENSEGFDNFYTDRLNESDVVIFPNPTRGALAVEIRNMNLEIPHQITVLSLNGSIVFQRNNVESFTEIDLSSRPRGVYLLRISSPDSFITWTIIKE